MEATTLPPVALVVDDQDELVTALIAALEGEGYHVLDAADVASAEAVLKSNEVDVLVMDEDVAPDEDGLQAIEAREPDLRIVMLGGAAAGQEVLLQPWFTSGQRYVLRKPYTLADLLATVRDAAPIPEAPDEDLTEDDEADG